MGTTRVKLINLNNQEQTSKKKVKVNTPKTAPQTEENTKQPKEQVLEKSQAPFKQKKAAKTKGAQKRRHLGTKYIKAKNKVETGKVYPVSEAFTLLEETSFTKFDPSVEIHLNVSDKSVKGTINFPHSIGPKKEKKILVFGNKSKEPNDKNIIWGDEKTIGEIVAGNLKPKRDFDMVVAAPAYMPALAQAAKILGPAGMMPNPKNGTIVQNPQTAISEKSSSSGVDFRPDPSSPVVHLKIGKLSNNKEELKENLKTALSTIGPAKIKTAVITSTMGPAIRLDISSVFK